MKAKEILAAGYVRDILFRSEEVFDLYLYNLDQRKIYYKVIETFTLDDGSIIARILQQHNNAKLIHLF